MSSSTTTSGRSDTDSQPTVASIHRRVSSHNAIFSMLNASPTRSVMDTVGTRNNGGDSDAATDDSDTTSDFESVARPSLYRHKPVPRTALFEKYYGDRARSVRLLDELKSNRLEGVYNLSFLLLAFAFLYLFIRNIIETGFRAGPSAICFQSLFKDIRVTSLLALLLPIGFCPSFLLIVVHARNKLHTRAVMTAHIITLTIFFTIATVVIFRARVNPLSGVTCGVVVLIVALKMHSYVMTNLILAEETEKLKRKVEGRRNVSKLRNRKIRDASYDDISGRSNSTSCSATTIAYPLNVTLENFCYFIVAPTLVYETSYPRTPCIRLQYILWHVSQFCLCLLLQYILLMQFCVPIWKAAQESGRLWWYSMKLALPCFIIWLLLFWGIFHCALNVIAELTRFADREFYRDWWNATDLSQFWRLWNIPMHEWCFRHLFVETVFRHKKNTKVALLSTFILSASFHEYVCIVGFRTIRPYMFVGMMMQVPLIKWSTKWAGTRTGNYIMWTMLFLGQSWVPLLYCTEYILKNRTLMCEL